MNSCLLIVRFWPVLGGQDEIGEVFEHPVVLEGVIDDSQEFARQCDVGLASAAAALDTLIEVLQERAVAFGDERALHQAGAREFVALLGDVSGVFVSLEFCTRGTRPR